MRDPNRIDEFCERLAKTWKKNEPDWRFGQLFMNLPWQRDPFFIEDDKMIQFIENTLSTGGCYRAECDNQTKAST